jgi:glycosyltransferase involved in cell wall biosynthesis
MAKNAIKILSNNQTLNFFKENSLKVAMQFDIKNIVPLYEKLYQEAIYHSK